MYANIMVPLDGSQLSERVLPYVRCLARALKVAVELVQSIDPEVVTVFFRSPARALLRCCRLYHEI